MRPFMITSALVAAVLLGGCGEAPPPVTPAAPESTAGSAAATTQPSHHTSTHPTSGHPAAVERCRTAQLSAQLGSSPKPSSGQTVVPLVYKNISKQPCQLHGVPGLDLHGPADPNGPVYSLPRQDKGGNFRLEPGAGASAKIVVLSDSAGSVGSFGSKNWVPTKLVTIPPGDTTPLTVPWPAGLSVQRQDAATHPGSWVESFTEAVR